MEVLKILWEHGPSTIRQVHNLLEVQRREWAYNTVLTLMSRLRVKRIVKRDGVKSPHVFRAIVTREKLLRHRLGDLRARLCGGEASPLVYALVHGQRFSPEEIAEFRELLDILERKDVASAKSGTKR